MRQLLTDELSDDDNTPFCGHSPAYVVQIIQNHRVEATVSLCGLCRTWAQDGELFVLKGTKALEFLQRKLPLPDVFQGIKTALELHELSRYRSTPFFAIPVANGDN